MEEEIWKDLELDGVEKSRYKISNYGRVWSDGYYHRNLHKTKYEGHYLKMCDNGNGYLSVGLRLESGGYIRRYIHRLVAQHFLPNPNNCPQVGHKNDDKSNNVVDNLYWCTGSRNIKDAHKTGRMKTRSEYGTIARYDSDIIIAAYTEVVAEKNGLSKTAEKYGMPRTTLSSIVNKRSRSDITDKIDFSLDNPQKL